MHVNAQKYMVSLWESSPDKSAAEDIFCLDLSWALRIRMVSIFAFR